MAFDVIYKGQRAGQQVDFQTGSLTDISTFTGDVRGAAIQNSISSSETAIGASQSAIHAMSGVLSSTAHPTVSAGTSILEDNSDGTVIQDLTITIDATGHVTATNVDTVNLDDRYLPLGTGAIIEQNTADIDSLSGSILSNDGELTQLFAESDALSGLIDQSEADIDTLSGLIDQSEADIDTLSGLIDTAEADIVDLSGTMDALTLDDVVTNNGTTTSDIQVSDIRVDGGNITGPATITIDPDSSGAAGTVVIQGDLQVEGTTTTVNSTTVELGDLNLTLGTGAANAAALNGGGIQLSGTTGLTAEFVYAQNGDKWTTNGLDIEADIIGTATGADAWTSERTITLGGDLGGSVSIDGSANATLTATIQSGSVTNSMLEGSIANGKLANSYISIEAGSGLVGGGSAELGTTVTLNIGAGSGIEISSDEVNIRTNSSFAISSDELTLAAGGVSANNLATNAVTSIKINNGAVTSGKIANDAVRSQHILDGEVLTAALANSAVSSDKIAANAVVSGKLGADSVGAAELDASVAGENITFTNGVLSVADSDIQAGVTGGASTIASSNLTASRALISNGSGKVAVSAVTSTELGYLDNVSSNIQNQLNNKASTSTQMIAGNGLSGGGTLAANRTFTVSSDQGHINEIKLGEDNTNISGVTSKGGILIIRSTGEAGLNTQGSGETNIIDLANKTTVSFDGIIQTADTNQDSDDGLYNALWKAQGIIRRDSGGTTSLVQSFVTKVHGGSNTSSYELQISVAGSGLKINVNDTGSELGSNVINGGTINYNWLQED